MRILAINNYDLEWAYKESGEVPMHQTWGVSYLREKGHVVDTVTYANQGGQFKLLLFNLKLFLRSFKYDIIISFYSPCIYILAYLKMLRMVRAKLFTYVHHHSKKVFLPAGFDGFIYLSKHIMQMDSNICKSNKTFLIDWSPELDFYNKAFEEMRKTANQRYQSPVFVSTGKSSRNHVLLQKACNDLKCNAFIFDKAIEEDHYVQVKESKGYHYMLDIMSKCAINVVPCRNRNENTSLCGLTSVIDGLALGMPLLISDNSNISFDVEEEGFGLYYKADDVDDLEKKMKYMISHPKELEIMGIKARRFAENHSYLYYCNTLADILMA